MPDLYETRPLHDRFGIEIVGVDLSDDLSDDAFAFIRRQLAEAGVVLVRGQQHMMPAQQIAFSARFGPLEHHVLNQFVLPEHPEIFVVSNIIENGKHIGAHDGSTNYHSDLAYLPEPSLGSVFRCLECPDEGGETSFISMTAAYHDLPDDLRKRLDSADAVFDYIWSYDRRHRQYRGPMSEEQKAKTPPVTHPAVRAHPETGEPILFISDNWVRTMTGMSEDETQAVLADVMAIATRPENEYRHSWTPGDVLIWDNRSTMHKACPYDKDNTRRLMHRTTIKGDRPFRASAG